MTLEVIKNEAGLSPIRVLALGHEASLSGAAIIHRAWLQWAIVQPKYHEIRSVLVRRGPLLDQWPRGLRLDLLSRFDRDRGLGWCGMRSRIVDGRAIIAWRFRRLVRRHNIGPETVVLVNTLTLGWLLPILEARRCRVVIHAHELAGSTRRFVSPKDLTVMCRVAERWIAVSEAEKRHLIEVLGVSADRIALVRNFVPPRPVRLSNPAETKITLGRRYGIPVDVPWIVAVGNIAPVKAPEIFLEVARLVQQHRNAVAFIWIGDGTKTAYGRRLTSCSGANNVHWLGFREDPTSWLDAATMVLVTSVEESSSLVALEAAQLGRPTLAFADTGGIDEFLAGGSGFLVAERSAKSMAMAVMKLIENPAEALRAGHLAKVKVCVESNYERQCETLSTILERMPKVRPT